MSAEDVIQALSEKKLIRRSATINTGKATSYLLNNESYNILHTKSDHPVTQYQGKVIIFPRSKSESIFDYAIINAIHPDVFFSNIQNREIKKIFLFNIDILFIPEMK